MSNLLRVLSKFNLYYGCHGNGCILYSLNELFLEDIFFPHLVGPSEQIDAHDKLSCVCKIG